MEWLNTNKKKKKEKANINTSCYTFKVTEIESSVSGDVSDYN